MGSRRKHRWLSVGLFGSALLALGLPLVIAALWSLIDPKVGWFAPDVFPRGFSTHFWQDTLRDPGIFRSMILSLVIAAIVTLFSGALALPTAYALARIPFRAKRAVEIFVLAPLIVPGIIIGVALGTIFFQLDLVFSVPGVVLAQTVGTLPFMIRILSAALEGIPEDILLAARTLGAGPLQVARYLIVPLARPGFFAGGLLTFILSFEEFDKTFIVGAPIVQTLPIRLWKFLGGQLIIFPNAAVVTFVLIAPMILIFFLADRVLKEDVLAAGMGKL
ncbi:MAG: ABC transporter permease [Truepera sp.]|nr:ABC transporter permease [Truepera sp.]